MAKKKVTNTAKPVKPVKNVIAEQIKALIDAGDFQGAQELINGQVEKVAPPPLKKKGRPPKNTINVAPQAPPPPSSPANNSSCIAPSKRVDAPVRRSKIVKDGKEYTVSTKVPWTKPKKIVFKEDKAVARDVGLHYPDRPTPRDPVEQIEYICHECNGRFWLYPGYGPEGDMLYTCDSCMKRNRRR